MLSCPFDDQPAFLPGILYARAYRRAPSSVSSSGTSVRIIQTHALQSARLEDQGDIMTHDLWRLLILLVIAVWLAAHDHRLRDSETDSVERLH